MYMYHTDGPPCILGRYRLLGKLMGKGNYARVEEAVHLDVDNAHVAVKMIDTHTVKDQYVLRHLEREAKVLQQLKHPNIMAIFEVLRTGSHYCMVTEPLYGGELCAHVNRQPRGHLDEATTLVFGAQLISAVAHMHALHVVHRDLKTKNIMLSKRGDMVKIVDFGLGRTWSRTRPLLTHCGSPGYAAPEIYQRDRPYGPEVDLWSLGVVLYYMAVGRMPFPPCRDKGRTAEERRRRLVAMISKGATDHHVKLMGHYSPEFRDLVQGLLTASVSRRTTLQQAIQHPWVANRLRSRQLIDIQYKLSSRERALVLANVAILMKSTVQSIEAQWRQNRLGEIAAMCNILAHKQLTTYHASWALRPVSPKLTGIMGASASKPYTPKGPPGHRAPHGDPQHHPGPSSRSEEAVVDQPPSSAYEGGDDDDDDHVQGSGASVTSLCSELEHAALPPTHQPLALLHAPLDQDEEDHDEHDQDGEDGSMEESATEIMEPRTEDIDELAGRTTVTNDVEEGGTTLEAAAKVEDTMKTVDSEESEAKGQAGKVHADDAHAAGGKTQMADYVVGCLLNDGNGQEQLQPLPETKVMFFTETILDNIHATMGPSPSKSKEACTASVGTNNTAPPAPPVPPAPPIALPIKSALASQTGLAAKTRKAVSFSIIATEAQATQAQSTDSVVVEGQHREAGVQANLGNLYSHTGPGPGPGPGPLARDKSQPLPQPNSESQTSAAELLSQTSSNTAQTGNPVFTQSSSLKDYHGTHLAGATSSREHDICKPSSNPQVELNEGNEPSTQDIRLDNPAMATKFFNTVPLSRKVSPEPKKNIYEARRWPFRSPRLVYQRMKSQSKLSVAYLLGSQENLINIKSKQESTSSPVPTHTTILPAHQEESGEDEAVGTHTSYEIQTRGNVMQKEISTKQHGDNNASSASGAHAGEKSKHIPPNQDSHLNTKGPLQSVAAMVRTKLGAVKEKNTDHQQKGISQRKALPKETKRGSPARYRRFFPNRYRVDLALVMTLERSSKLILPSINTPWIPPKPGK